MLLSGLWVTLQLAAYTIVLSTVVGVFVALGRVSRSRGLAPVRWALTAYVEFFRNVPLMVQLVFWGFAVFATEPVRALVSPLNGLYSNQFIAGVCGLTVYTSAYIAEVVRSGLQSVPRGQMEAARSAGLSHGQAMRLVILPQVARLVVAPMGNQYIGATKNTSIVMVLGVTNLVFQAQQIEAATFRGVEAYTAVIVIFLFICLLESIVMNLVTRRWAGDGGRPRSLRKAVALESE